MASWYSQDMASQKFLRSSEICEEDTGLTIAGGKENFGGWYKENLAYPLALSVGLQKGTLSFRSQLHGDGQEYTAREGRS